MVFGFGVFTPYHAVPKHDERFVLNIDVKMVLNSGQEWNSFWSWFGFLVLVLSLGLAVLISGSGVAFGFG